MSAPAGPAVADASRLRAEGGGRSSKRERILGAFLKHEGQLGADDLVALIRREAREVAKARGLDLILVDGPPGIGCPVIASLSGADHVVIVTEPTVSGMHDMERVIMLANHFQVPASVIVNKADLNQANAAEIVNYARIHGVGMLGEIPYDPVITHAQLACQSVVEFGDNAASDSLRAIWNRLTQHLVKE